MKGSRVKHIEWFIRDYIYILDAVNFYLYLAEKMDERKFDSEAFYFCIKYN